MHTQQTTLDKSKTDDKRREQLGNTNNTNRV